MFRPSILLSPAFFNRDPRKVARDLLGKVLVRKVGRKKLAGRIVETEAYLGAGDAAAHSAAGKTLRNSVLFGPPGFAYVYFIYGNHYCLNVSCLPEGDAGGVLFRALGPIDGIAEMARARGITLPADSGVADFDKLADSKTRLLLRKISSGPGRMCEALDITRERDNGKSFVSPRSDLQIVDDGYRVRHVQAGPRVGIKKSLEHNWRYVIANNPFVSAPAVR